MKTVYTTRYAGFAETWKRLHRNVSHAKAKRVKEGIAREGRPCMITSGPPPKMTPQAYRKRYHPAK